MNTPLASITIAALGGHQVSASGLVNDEHPNRCSVTTYTTGDEGMQRLLPDLADGGYVVDLRPLEHHKDLVHWVFGCPMANGVLGEETLSPCPGEVRKSALRMAPWLEGEFQAAALLTATGQMNFDYCTEDYRARYWLARGARVGQRVGNVIHWSDGSQQQIEEDK